MRSLIAFVLSNYSFTFFFLGLIGAAVSLSRRKQTLTWPIIAEVFLAYFVLFSVGVFFLYNSIMHIAFHEMAARFIGWEASPFQYEVGFASLGFGLIGILAFKGDRGLRLAALLGTTPFAWGAAIGHAYHMIEDHNFAPGNAGSMFWGDIFLPCVGWFLFWQSRPRGPRRSA